MLELLDDVEIKFDNQDDNIAIKNYLKHLI